MNSPLRRFDRFIEGAAYTLPPPVTPPGTATTDATRWGLTLPFPGLSLADHEQPIRQAEAAGFSDLWTGDTPGPDVFPPLAPAAPRTARGRLASTSANAS